MIFKNVCWSAGLQVRWSVCPVRFLTRRPEDQKTRRQLRENLSDIMFFSNKKLSLQTKF
jgi:hypothetical protein